MTRHFPEIVTVELWPGRDTTDPTFEPTSRYSESFWLPVIGPASLFAARKMFLRGRLGSYEQNIRDLALELGLRRFPVVERCLERLEHFKLAKFFEDRNVYSLCSAWPTLSEFQTDRLPDGLRRHARPPQRLQEAG